MDVDEYECLTLANNDICRWTRDIAGSRTQGEITDAAVVSSAIDYSVGSGSTVNPGSGWTIFEIDNAQTNDLSAAILDEDYIQMEFITPPCD